MKATAHRSRAEPASAEARQQVALRLFPQEKAELEDLAEREDRSASSFARLIYLKGLEAYKREGTCSVSGDRSPNTIRFAGC